MDVAARIRAQSDAEGEFALRSAEPYDRLWVYAYSPQHLAGSPLQVEPGARDLRFVLALGGNLELSVLLPPGTRRSDLSFHLERTVQGRFHHGWWRMDPVGGFRSTALEPGTYRLLARRGDSGRAIIVREDIPVRAGETTRLEPIDLTALLGDR